MSSEFSFGHVSQKNLNGVHPDLVQVCEVAIGMSPVDFGITCGLRPLKTQVQYFEAGKSKTLKSLHLVGHAVDIIPFARGGYRADCWPLYYPIADAFLKAAILKSTRIVWGGAWGTELSDHFDVLSAQLDYIERKEEGATDYFFDGPHFELSTQAYPPDFSGLSPELDRTFLI